jgi:hypothetical protein
MILLCAAILEAVWTPFEIAFLGTDSLAIDVDALFLLNRVVDAAFVLDVGLCIALNDAHWSDLYL